jgi:WD40 repeat protein
MYGTAFDLSLSPIKRCVVRGNPDGKSWEILLTGLSFSSGTSCLSPDRRRIALASAPNKDSAWRIELWDVPSAKLVARLGGHWNLISSLQFSEDGTKLASRAGDLVKIWNVAGTDGK